MDVQYIVDSAAELGEITPLECTALYLLESGYQAVDRIVANNETMPDDFLQNTARRALRAAPQERQHWVALNSLSRVRPLSRFVQERASYVLQTKIQHDLGRSAPFPMLAGSVESSTGFWTDRVVTSEDDVTETAVRSMLSRYMGNLYQRLADDNTDLEAAMAWYQGDDGQQFRQMQEARRASSSVRGAVTSAELLAVVRVHKDRKRLASKRPVRGAIKKVSKLFAQFRQEENLRLFVSGQEVELAFPGSQFKFVVRPLGEPGWLEERSAKGQAHTPYDLTLLTKEDVFIARLCVFFTDTPVLDQLLALSLFVQAGDELKVLEKANFFSFGTTGNAAKESFLAAYPSLTSKFPQPKTVDADGIETGGSRMRVIDLGAPFRAEEEHWAPFKARVEAWIGTWFEPVFSPVLPHVRQLALGV